MKTETKEWTLQSEHKKRAEGKGFFIQDAVGKPPVAIADTLEHATIIVKSVNAYPEFRKALEDLKEVLIEAKLTIHAKGIEELLKKYN